MEKSFTKNHIKLIFLNKLANLLFLIILIQINGYAQVSNIMEAQAQEELAKIGITEEELKVKLREKGYDVDNMQPEQFPEIQGVIVDTISELEDEKREHLENDSLKNQKELETNINPEVFEELQQSLVLKNDTLQMSNLYSLNIASEDMKSYYKVDSYGWSSIISSYPIIPNTTTIVDFYLENGYSFVIGCGQKN